MGQIPPIQALKEAPKEIRRAATVALVASSLSRALGILFATIIIATLPTWVPGLLAIQPLPIALLILAIGCNIAAGKGSRIREKIASREFESARGSSLSARILGFVLAGAIPGLLYFCGLQTTLMGVAKRGLQGPSLEQRTGHLSVS